jgi:glutamine cyclotransferase
MHRFSRSHRALWSGVLVFAALLLVSIVYTQKSAPVSTPAKYRVEVLRKLPHDRGAFTQGLLLHEGRLYESTGLYGESTLRRVDPETGKVEAAVALSPKYFAEGLALVENRLIQLTWREGTALVYDVNSLEQIDQFEYEGEGWGLAFDGTRLIMTSGDAFLQFRDPATFEKLGAVQVTLEGKPLRNLNELEYSEGFVYANVWTTESIVKIDPASGAVVGIIDATGLLSEEERAGVDVLNGISASGKPSHFLITGKKWPALFEVKFVPVESGP